MAKWGMLCCNLLKTILPSQILLSRKISTYLTLTMYDRLEQAVRWRHLHVWNAAPLQLRKKSLLLR